MSNIEPQNTQREKTIDDIIKGLNHQYSSAKIILTDDPRSAASNTVIYIISEEKSAEPFTDYNRTERLFFAKQDLFDAITEAMQSPDCRSEKKLHGIYYLHSDCTDLSQSQLRTDTKNARESAFVYLAVDLSGEKPSIEARYEIRKRDEPYRIESGNDFMEWKDDRWVHMYWDSDIGRAYPERFDSKCRSIIMDHFKLDRADSQLDEIEFTSPDMLKKRAEQIEKGD